MTGVRLVSVGLELMAVWLVLAAIQRREKGQY